MKNKKQTESAPSVISAKEYAALSPEERREWRAVDPRRERLPIVSYVFFGLGALALIIYVTARLWPGFADFFNQTSRILRYKESILHCIPFLKTSP